MKWRTSFLTILIWVTLFISNLISTSHAAHWEWQNPLTTNNSLQDVWRFGGEIFAVGEAGTIIHYDGATWTIMESGTSEWLYGVWGTAVDSVFAVGLSGTILRYDGTTWTPMVSNTTSTLYSVWGSSADDVYAVGSSGTVLNYNGSVWTTMTTPASTPLLYGVWGDSLGEVYAVGSTGTIWQYFDATWTEMTSGTTNYLNAVWGTSNTDIYAVGSQGTILHYTGGPDWAAMTPVPSTSVVLNAIWGSGTSIFVAGSSGTAWRYSAVAGWTAMTSGTTQGLVGISGNNENDVSAVGSNGTVLHYDGNGANTWSPMPNTGVTVDLEDIYSNTGINVYAVGYTGTILQYNGSTWPEIATTTTERLNAVWVSANGHVFAVGDNGIVVHYNGSIWSESNPTTEGLYEVWGSADNDVFAVGSNGTILHYDGTDWTIMSSDGVTESLVGIWGSASNDIFALGSLGAVLHYDGSSWTHTDTLSDEFDSGDIWGSSGSNVYAVGRYGVIYQYNGTGWNKIYDSGSGDFESIWGSSANDIYVVGVNRWVHYDGYVWHNISVPESLNSIWGSSEADVFGVGNTGTILHYVLDAYYVDITRPDDSGDGTSPASAWKTLHHAVDQINNLPIGNYRLDIAPGTYSVVTGESDAVLSLNQENVLLQGETGVVIDGDQAGGNTVWTAGITVNASQVTLRNLEFRYFNYGIDPAIDVMDVWNVRIEDCTIHDNYEGVYVGRYALIHSCEFYNNDTGVYVLDADVDILSNTFRENAGQYDIYIESTQIEGPQPEIVNNLFYRPTSGGTAIYLYANDGSIAPLVYHNTINNLFNGVYMYMTPSGILQPVISYNIIGGANGVSISFNEPFGSDFTGTVDYNNLWNNASDYSLRNYTPTNGISADPQYIDAAAGDFHLQSGSPSRNAIPTTESDPVMDDLEGSFRPDGTGYDMGCYESAGITPTQYTLTVTVVGNGSVSETPSGGVHIEGTQVILVPIPDTGWAFDQWSGDLTGSDDPAVITMDSDKAIVATFVQKSSPDTPTASIPAHEAIIAFGNTVTLDTSTYRDPDGDGHVRSHWEVWRADTGEFLSLYPLASVTDLEAHIITDTLEEGFKYEWQVSYEDADGNLSPSQVYSFKIGTSQPESLPEVTAGEDVGDFGMISIVHWPDDPDPTAVFNIDYDPANYRIGTYDALTGGYIEFGEGVEMEPGQAYWILAREGLTVNFNGIPVSLTANVYVALDYNENTSNGWNMVAPPNNADYYYGDVQVVVDVAGTLTPMGTLSQLADDNPYIDRRLWWWANGEYVSDIPENEPVMEAYAGYWVRSRQADVYLRFDPGAQLSALEHQGTMVAHIWHKTKSWLRNLSIFSQEAIADNDSPPMPPAALDENTVDPVIEGCFIDSTESF